MSDNTRIALHYNKNGLQVKNFEGGTSVQFLDGVYMDKEGMVNTLERVVTTIELPNGDRIGLSDELLDLILEGSIQNESN
jgi:hypothetical protein